MPNELEQGQAARFPEMSRQTIYSKIKEYDLVKH